MSTASIKLKWAYCIVIYTHLIRHADRRSIEIRQLIYKMKFERHHAHIT